MSSPNSGGDYITTRQTEGTSYKEFTDQIKVTIPWLEESGQKEAKSPEMLTNCLASAWRRISLGTPLNCRRGVIELHILFSAILHMSSAARAGIAHPRLRQISNIARRILHCVNLLEKQSGFKRVLLTDRQIAGHIPCPRPMQNLEGGSDLSFFEAKIRSFTFQR
jgi:hypothetical protein